MRYFFISVCDSVKHDNHSWRIVAIGCGYAWKTRHWSDTKEEAINDWNRRLDNEM